MTDAMSVARASFLEDWRQLMGTVYDGAAVRELPGVLLSSSGIPTAIMNKAFVYAEPEPGWTEEAASFFEQLGVPYSVEIRHGLSVQPPGLTQIGDSPFMVCRQLDTTRFPLPDGYSLVVVTDELQALDFATAASQGFGLPHDWLARFSKESLGVPAIHQLLATFEGQPVATSVSTSVGDGATGIYTVATIPAHRGRGLGAALTAAAAAAGGAPIAYLQASSMGKPVYERMGFTTSATDPVWGVPARPAT